MTVGEYGGLFTGEILRDTRAAQHSQQQTFLRLSEISYLPNLCMDTPRICNFYYVVAFCYQDVTVREIRGR